MWLAKKYVENAIKKQDWKEVYRRLKLVDGFLYSKERIELEKISFNAPEDVWRLLIRG